MAETRRLKAARRSTQQREDAVAGDERAIASLQNHYKKVNVRRRKLRQERREAIDAGDEAAIARREKENKSARQYEKRDRAAAEDGDEGAMAREATRALRAKRNTARKIAAMLVVREEK